MTREDFTVELNHRGYIAYYKGRSIGGAGTIESNYTKKRKHWRTQDADIKMYRAMAERHIENYIKQEKE